MEWFGVRILGANAETALKVVLTLVVLAVALGIRAALRVVVRRNASKATRRSVWIRKTIRLAVGAIATLVLLSIWFDDPDNLAVFGGLVGAGLAFASQNLLLSVAGYFVIVAGKTFDIGDRIELGGVRGDVLDIGLFKTTIMEMGVPVSLIPDPNHWVAARQYTGRVVTVVNAEVFRQPVFNYTATLEFLWEELQVPVRFGSDIREAERVLLGAAQESTRELIQRAREQLVRLRELYVIQASDLEPRVYVRITDSWVELTVRFLAGAWGVRELKDRISRAVLEGFRSAGIEIASTTVELVRAPEIRVHEDGSPP